MILFDGSARTITFTTPGSVSLRVLWSEYLRWHAQPGNRKYAPMLTSVGMITTDIPLYLFLGAGVTLVATDNSLPLVVGDGVLKTHDGRDPFGGAVVNVRYEAPGIAIGYSTTGGTGPTAESIAAATVAAMITPLTLQQFIALK